MTTILVTGATGNVGRQVLTQLQATGTPARALIRSPDGEGVVGDLSSSDTLERALSGIETVFLIWPFLTAEGAAAVLDVIGRHARQVVYLSSSGVDDNAVLQSDPINQIHADVERLIQKSGLRSTILRANTIASNTLGWAGQIRDTGVVRGPDIAATAVIDPRDIAAVAVHALTSDAQADATYTRADATYVLTGPEVLSRAEQVRTIGEVIGRPLRFDPVPVEEARRQMLADGRPPALVEALLASAEKRPHSDLITRTVEDLTGSPARTFREWAADHAAAFRTT